jgi:hypothetical protein
MPEDEAEFAEEPSSRLAKDLASLYAPPAAVPARVDDAILNRAHAQMLRSRRRTRTLRWMGAAAAVAALAACVVLAVHFTLPGSSAPPQRGAPVAIQVQPQNRVTILDALKLAREIRSGSGHDVNGDGQVDQRDVDALASAAVQLDAQQGDVQ